MYTTTSFSQFTRWASNLAGSSRAFLIAMAVILAWGITGPIFGFSDTWQLVINTGTTIITFLMVFLIQNTQNRDSMAMQVKLDELIRATSGAHNALLDYEELAQEDLELIRGNYEELAREAREGLRRGSSDMGTPEVQKPSQAIGRGNSKR
ncbi:MAG: low affinity iron permease family protein [Chloroflexi bacterium]|nr:low affinity iron permease family protein [Chloroflexota bacterium]